MPLLARAPLVRQHLVRTRFTTPYGAHSYHHFPFAFPTNKNKAVWGAKLALYLGTGFSIPFVAVWYQLRKAAAA